MCSDRRTLLFQQGEDGLVRAPEKGAFSRQGGDARPVEVEAHLRGHAAEGHAPALLFQPGAQLQHACAPDTSRLGMPRSEKMTSRQSGISVIRRLNSSTAPKNSEPVT